METATPKHRLLKSYTAEEELELVEQARGGNQEAIDKVVLGLSGFAKTFPRRWHLESHEEDLVSECYLGILEAIERFNPEKGVRFITYAVWHMFRRCSDYMKEMKEPLKLASAFLVHYGKMQKAIERLEKKHGRSISPEEALEKSGASKATVHLLRVGTDINIESMKGISPVYNWGMRVKSLCVDPRTPERGYQEEYWSQWAPVLEDLSERERYIIEGYYGFHSGGPKTLQEIGNELELSRERVRQIKDKAMKYIRRARSIEVIKEDPEAERDRIERACRLTDTYTAAGKMLDV